MRRKSPRPRRDRQAELSRPKRTNKRLEAEIHYGITSLDTLSIGGLMKFR